MRLNWKRLIVFCVLCCSSPLFAEEDNPVAAEPVVITVSAREVPISATSATVSIISREQIEKSQAQNVIEVLRQLGSLHVSQTGGLGGLTTVTMRGGDPNFTLVMVDGIPVNDLTNILGGSFDFSTLSIDNIQQIEIVRGPLSSLHGSEAIAGVINIISRRGDGESSLQFEAMAGNFDSFKAAATGEGQIDRFHYSFGTSYLDVGEQVERDEYSLGTASLTSDFAVTDQSHLHFLTRYARNEVSGFPDNGGGPLFSLLRDPRLSDAEEWLGGIQYRQKVNAAWNFDLRLDHYSRNQETDTPAVLDEIPPSFRSLPPFTSDSNFDRSRIQLNSQWSAGNFSIIGSAAYRKEEGVSRTLIADVFPSNFQIDRGTRSVSGEVHYRGRMLNVNLGFRVDDAGEFDTEFLPRMGASYLFTKSKTRVRASWGEGYKLPSFFSLAEPNIGNPALRAEHSTGFDIGVEQELGGRGIAVLTVFRNKFRDLIDFSAEEFRLVNRSEVETKGIEMEGRMEVANGLQLAAQVAYVSADIIGSIEPLRDRPRWRGAVDISWRVFSGSDLVVSAIFVGSRFDFQIPVPERTVARKYTTVNVSYTHRFTNEFSAFARIENLFDNEYQEFIGFPNPGRYLRAGISYRLR